MKCKVQKQKKCLPVFFFEGAISAPVHDSFFGPARCYYCDKEFKVKYIPVRKKR